MSHPFDATLKQIVQESEADYAPVFGLRTDLPAKPLNVDLSTLSAATDVAFGYGDPIQEITDLNFQSGPDADIVARVQYYGAAYRMKFQVPIRSIIILLRPAADHFGLDGKLAFTAGKTRLQFECEVIRLWKEPVELYLTGGIGALPLAPLCQMPPGVALEDALKRVIHEIDERLSAEADHAKAVKLMTGAYILIGMRIPKWTVDEIFQGVRVMHDSSTFELIEDKARIRQLHRDVLQGGRHRFGPADTAMVAAVSAINDLDRLERMFDAVFTASNWQDLLATL